MVFGMWKFMRGRTSAPPQTESVSQDLPGRCGARSDRGDALLFTFDGQEFSAYEGESVAAALMAAGLFAVRRL